MFWRCFIFILLFFKASSIFASAYNIFILHSYHPEYPWTQEQEKGFRDAINTLLPKEKPVSIKVEHLDTKRLILNPDYEKSFRDLLVSRYEHFKPDLVYVTDDNAFHFWKKHYHKIFPGSPVTFSGVNATVSDFFFNSHPFTGVLERKEILPNIHLLRQIFPQSQKVYFIGDDSFTAQKIKQNVSKVLKKQSIFKKYDFINASSLDELTAQLKNIQPDSVVVLTTIGKWTHYLSSTGEKALPLNELLALISSMLPNPPLCMEDIYVHSGILGGFVTSGYHHGEKAGFLGVLAMFSHKEKKKLPPPEVGQSVYMFDHNLIKPYLSRLPNGVKMVSAFINEEPVFYDRYKNWITRLLYLLTVILLAVSFAFILVLRKKNRSIQKQKNQIEEKSSKLEHKIKMLSEYKRAFEAGNIVSVTTPDGIIKEVNNTFCKVTGYEHDEVIGKTHSIFRHPQIADEIYTSLWETIKSRQVWKGIMVNRHKSGRDLYLDTTIVPIINEYDQIEEFIAGRNDITHLINQEKVIHKQTIDLLTGLPNRVQLFQDIEHIKNPVLILLDIDNFHQFNSLYGFEAGDELLSSYSEFLAQLSNLKKFTLYRTSSDEFALLGREISSSSLDLLVTELATMLENRPMVIGANQYYIDTTIGYAFGNKNLYNLADMALKNARKQNKHYMLYEKMDDLTGDYQENLHWIQHIKQAISEEKILPFFQSIVDNKTGEIIRYEALVRIVHDDKIFLPGDFLDIAKSTKFYTAITRQVIQKTFDYFRENPGNFSINISFTDIMDEETADFLMYHFSDPQMGPRATIEITENEGIENFEPVLAFIKEVQKKGCRVALDDFGAGYSNFSYLTQMKIDSIKIDGSILKNIVEDKNSRLMAETIVALAKQIGAETVAEFVENEQIFEVVKELGIDQSQGYFFSEPYDLIGISNVKSS